jgi:very-short-patch-repair endonuclease
VETDGARYHDHAIARRRDAAKTAHLQHLGYTVLRLREVETTAVARALNRPASRTAS